MTGLSYMIEAMGKMNVVVIIPARGGSKRLPRKNIHSIWGKPMISWPIQAAKNSKYINEVWVTTEDEEIATIAKDCGAEVHDRDPILSGDHIYKMEAVRDCFRKIQERKPNINIVISLQANSPQITSKILDSAIECFIENGRNELMSVGVDLMQNAAFRILKSDYVFQKDLSTKCGVYVCDLVDIHTINDVNLLEEIKK